MYFRYYGLPEKSNPIFTEVEVKEARQRLTNSKIPRSGQVNTDSSNIRKINDNNKSQIKPLRRINTLSKFTDL